MNQEVTADTKIVDAHTYLNKNCYDKKGYINQLDLRQ